MSTQQDLSRLQFPELVGVRLEDRSTAFHSLAALP
jgi:hypothetical protein